jgi:hypothetical protein
MGITSGRRQACSDVNEMVALLAVKTESVLFK